MLDVRSVAFTFLAATASLAAADDADTNIRRLERGLITAAEITDDGKYVVVAGYRPAMDRGGFRWGAWIAIHDVEQRSSEYINDGVAPVALAPNQRQIAFARYTREPRANRPQCIGLTIWNFEDGSRTDLQLPPLMAAARSTSRTIIACDWNDAGSRLYALDLLGSLFVFDLSQPEMEAELIDRLQTSYPIGWSRSGLHRGIEFTGTDVQIRLTMLSDDHSRLHVIWNLDPDTNLWTRSSEMVEELDNPAAALVEANRLTTEFHSANGRFTLSDQLSELVLLDTETEESTSLPFLPERVFPRE